MSDKNVTAAQVQPVLANLVAGVATDPDFIAPALVPAVDTLGGEDFEWEKFDNSLLEDFAASDGLRALRGETDEITGGNTTTEKGTLDEHAFFVKYDYREINADRVSDRIRPVSAGMMSREERRRFRFSKKIRRALDIIYEKAVAARFFTAANYDAEFQLGALDFAAANIIDEFMKVRRAVAKKYGRYPDTLALGFDAFRRASKNAIILDRISGGATNMNPADVTPALLAQHLGVKNLKVGLAITQSVKDDGSPGTVTELWNSNYASLTFQDIGGVKLDTDGNLVAQFNDPDEGTPAFCKRFEMKVPETGVLYDIRTWQSANGKLEYQEGTEFWALVAPMKAGAIWTDTGAA